MNSVIERCAQGAELVPQKVQLKETVRVAGPFGRAEHDERANDPRDGSAWRDVRDLHSAS